MKTRSIILLAVALLLNPPLVFAQSKESSTANVVGTWTDGGVSPDADVNLIGTHLFRFYPNGKVAFGAPTSGEKGYSSNGKWQASGDSITFQINKSRWTGRLLNPSAMNIKSDIGERGFVKVSSNPDFDAKAAVRAFWTLFKPDAAQSKSGPDTQSITLVGAARNKLWRGDIELSANPWANALDLTVEKMELELLSLNDLPAEMKIQNGAAHLVGVLVRLILYPPQTPQGKRRAESGDPTYWQEREKQTIKKDFPMLSMDFKLLPNQSIVLNKAASLGHVALPQGWTSMTNEHQIIFCFESDDGEAIPVFYCMAGARKP